jgi:hypothetical protein
VAITDIKLSGKVFTDAGTAVNGATVALLETGSSTEEASTSTNSSGEWSFTETSLDTTYDIKISVGSSVRYILWSDEITATSIDAASMKIRGTEGAVAPLYFFADQADDAGDAWRIQASASDTLAIGSDKASAGTIIDYITITNGANAAASLTTILGKLTVGVDDTGADVKFFGATAGSYWLWDESADGVVQIGTLTVGVDDAGHDVKLFGDTASRYWLWDTSADGVVQRGTLTVGVDDTGHDVKLFGATAGSYWLWDESADGVVQIGTLTVGVDDAGHDVKFFGDTASAYMLWDTSADDLVLAGAAGIDLAGDIDVDGTANLDVVDIDGAVQIDATFTSGVDGQGYDTKFFGDTSGAYILWDTSADKLLTAGGAVVDIVKDKLLIGGTAVTTTAAELNVLDAVTAGTVTASLGVVVDSNKDIGTFRNITLSGELDAGSLDVSGDADIDGTLETDALTVGGTNVLTGSLITTLGTISAGVWNGTAITVAYGGTGATSLTDGGVLLGSGTGAITAMSVLSDSEMIVGNGSTDPVAESGATLRTSIGVGTGDSVEFAGIIGTTIDASTDFTIGGTVITDGVITDDLLQLTLTDASNKWLKIYKSASGATPASPSTLVLERDGNNYLTIATPNTAYASIWFADPQDSTAGGFQYYHADDTLTTLIGGGQQMVWTTSDISLENNTLSNVGNANNEWTQYNIVLKDTRSGSMQLLIENTSTNSAAHAVLRLDTAYDSDGANPVIHWRINGSPSQNWYAGIDNNESQRWSIGTNIPGTGDAMRISTADPPVITYNTTHPTGTFDYVCESCGTHQAELFDCCGAVEWHDDVMDFRAMALQDESAIDYMERVGVVERTTDNEGKPELFTKLGADFHFAMSAAFQNRERMDAQHQTIGERLNRIEQALGV